MTWRLPEYRIHPFFDPANPLLLLLTGPLDGNELVSLAQSLMPELREWKLQNFLIDLEKQEGDLEKQEDQKPPILVPNWWEGSPEQFLEEINSSLRLPSFTRDNSLEAQQSSIMEDVLSMWADHRYHVAD